MARSHRSSYVRANRGRRTQRAPRHGRPRDGAIGARTLSCMPGLSASDAHVAVFIGLHVFRWYRMESAASRSRFRGKRLRPEHSRAIFSDPNDPPTL
jgi:hypothetical protein